jgi:hypothetical protein
MERISLDEYAHIHMCQGHNVKLTGSTYWIEVRPFFYRPLVPYLAIASPTALPPCRLGIYQFAVENRSDANSTINFRIYEDCDAYSIAAQKNDVRRAVRIASSAFRVKRMEDEREIGQRGYELYRTFYKETRYRYLSARLQPSFFSKWVESLFICPKTVVLGGFAPDGLKAVAVCHWIGDLLLYSTFFSDKASLRRHIGDLMLHTIRQMAVGHKEIRRILAGMYCGGTGVDNFDLLRGAKIERKAARYVMCPSLIGVCVRTLSPSVLAKLSGDLPRSPA